MKTDTETGLGGCAVDLGVTLELPLFIVAEHSYLRWKAF